MVPLGNLSQTRRLLPGAPVRPPTPPRESDTHNSKPTSVFARAFSKDATAKLSSNITPNSSAESPNQTSGTTRKKVEWDDEATLSPVNQPPNQPVPSSGERKPIKSILKPYNVVNVSSLNLGPASKLPPPHSYANLAAMLESVAQQLAGEDRNSRMDAYMTLSGTIKAYDNVPDIRALKEKMGLLQQFMKRDLVARTEAGTVDTPLVINDLVLLSSFLHKSAIAEIFTNEFSAHIVDHAIKTFEDPAMSKDVAKHLMFIIAQQSFSAKIMTGERVGRLVAALHEIGVYVTGKSIISGRLNIYRNLIRKSKSSMLASSGWIEDIFDDVFNTAKDTRTHAILVGLEAALELGTESRASRAVMELFKREDIDTTVPSTYGAYLVERLQVLVRNKQEGRSSNVPQIWSIAILFLRYRPRQLEQWAFMTDWLKVIQECFNCSDQQTKLEANLAWNRFVFALQPDEKTSSSMIGMLCRPLIDQLKRKGKSTGRARKAALSSICVLLYYSLKPNSAPAQLDQYWDHYVVQIVEKTLVAPSAPLDRQFARRDMMDACLILKGLFDSTTPRLWNETRAMDINSTDMSMEPSELPPLDSKWLRKSASRVFAVLSHLLENLFWDLSEDGATITALWDAYITSIASPAVKEVKVANETMACVACIFNVLYRVWHIGPVNLQRLPAANGDTPDDFLGSFAKIALSMIDTLGVLPFTEKLLSIGGQDTFVVIATPSHRPRNSRGEIQCPLHHLFLLLTKVCPGLEYNDRFTLLVRRIISPFINARSSTKSQMELIRELLQLLPTGAEFNEPCKLIWQVLATFATRAADTRDENGNDNLRNNDQPLGVDYRNALEILEVGILQAPRAPLPGWRSLFEALVTSATLDAGDGGRAIAIIEPLTRTLTGKFSKSGTGSEYGLAYCHMIVSKANYPKDRQALDAARRRLWGAASGGLKPSAFDPYTELYKYLQGCLERSYLSFDKDQALEYSDMLSVTTALLGRCPEALLYDAYLNLQNGISCWILDEQSKLSGGNAYSQAIASLWAKFCSQLPNMKPQHSHSTILASLEPLLFSGLESRHKAIVNGTIQLWNSTFGDCVDGLEYPPKITAALLRLRPVVDLQLPFFPESLETEVSEENRQPPTFDDTQDELGSFFEESNEGMLGRSSASRSDSSKAQRQTAPGFMRGNLPVPGSFFKGFRDVTPDPETRNLKKRIPTPKLRHDDSQIQFEAIESSPMADEMLQSQLLTDRQREVKERQKQEAAMFPDLRSSPLARGGSVELPFHRSASKTSSMPLPNIARQTTPTLILQAEDDDFVNSSPTPTRALHGENTLEVPSSPPESATKPHVTHYEDESDIPSSPPEVAEEEGNDNMTPLDPSAQIDPYAAETARPVSTFEDTPDERTEPPASELSAKEASFKTERDTKLSSDEQPGPVNSKPNPVLVTSISTTDPSQAGESTSVAQQRFTTPTFHDALTSPVSSEGVNDNPDVFEDAVSSPRRNTEKMKTTNRSPSVSDFDESSMLRLVKEFDQGSGRPRRSVRFSTGKENQPLKPLSFNDSPYPTAPSDGLAGSSMDESHEEPGPVDATNQGPSPPSISKSQSSSFPSMIPETPGIKATMLQTDDGEELDPNDTIFVEVPDDYQAYKAPRRKRNKALFTRIRPMSASPASKKRKHEEAATYKKEGPDSQEVEIEYRETSPKGISPSKRRRSQRHSRLSQQTDMSQDSEPGPSQRSMSVDMNDSMDHLQFDTTAESGISTTKEEVKEGPSAASPVDKKLEAEVTTVEHMMVDATDIVEDLALPSIESADPPVESEPPKVSTMRGLTDQLQRLIGDLATAALTREEVNIFEDMFMDAKEKLYGAARRGRSGS